jgi:hypothetical protein
MISGHSTVVFMAGLGLWDTLGWEVILGFQMVNPSMPRGLDCCVNVSSDTVKPCAGGLCLSEEAVALGSSTLVPPGHW